jgi:hypothetical protein
MSLAMIWDNHLGKLAPSRVYSWFGHFGEDKEAPVTKA